MKTHLLFALITTFVQPTAAQEPVYETDAAFTRSQEIRKEAITAYRADDLESALSGMLHALEYRPTSIALLGTTIFLALEKGDLDTAAALSVRFANMGVNPGAGVQKKLQETLNDNDWQRLAAQFNANNQQRGQARPVASIPTQHRLVEGIATDGAGNLFLSTVITPTILKVSKDGITSVLFDGNEGAFGSFFGITYTSDTNSIYATFGTVEQTGATNRAIKETGIVRINASSGVLLEKWTLPGGADKQQIADITIAAGGMVYATEAQGGKIYTVANDTLAPLPTTARFMSPQGIISLEDGHLLMADYGRGLWRINPKTGAAILYGVPDTATLTGIDGLFSHHGRIIAIQNGTSPQRLIEIQLDDNTHSISHVTVITQNLPAFDEPTLGTSTPNGIVFVASSQWPKYAAAGTVREGVVIKPTLIMQISNAH